MAFEAHARPQCDPTAICCPQALKDIAISYSWEDGGSQLVLRAVCALPAGVLLTGNMLLLGVDAEQLLLSDGPEAVAEAERLSRGARPSSACAVALVPDPRECAGLCLTERS